MRSETIPGMIQAALAGVDVDIRPHLLASIVVTGGSTLINGFNDRLNYEVSTMYSTISRVRIQAPGSSVERKYAGWIGGSILASLGSFHQVCLTNPILGIRVAIVQSMLMWWNRCGYQRRSMTSSELESLRRGVSEKDERVRL